MTAISFDTLAYARKLEAAGVNREQSEVQAQALKEQADSQAAAIAAALDRHDAQWRKELATKSDLQEVRAEMQIMRAELKEEIQAVRTELKEEIHAVRTELKEEIQGVRTELKEEIQELRTEFKEEIQNVRNELKEEIQAVRTELKGDIQKLSDEFGTFKLDITKRLHSEMMILMGLMLTAMCAGFAVLAWLLPRT